jgi:hypothetical protein
MPHSLAQLKQIDFVTAPSPPSSCYDGTVPDAADLERAIESGTARSEKQKYKQRLFAQPAQM